MLLLLELELLLELSKILLFLDSNSNSILVSSIIEIIFFLVFNSFTTKYLVKLSLKVI